MFFCPRQRIHLAMMNVLTGKATEVAENAKE
jgi:hypothetical protein